MNLEILESFLNQFDLLTHFQKEIWRFLQKLSKEFRVVIPSQTEIANIVKCSRDTVNIAISKFIEMKWIEIKKRPYKSNLYFINPVLLDIDSSIPMRRIL